MGHTYQSLKFASEHPGYFRSSDVLTLGTLYPFLSPAEAARLRAVRIDATKPKELFSNHFFIDVLGARTCRAIDVSDYQGAEVICNLNQPIPERYRESADVVYDAGTLEHLSNLPMALDNIFSLLRPGGVYFFGAPCNNWVDHGFFQFSPTFYHDLCLDNASLELIELYIAEKKRYFDYKSLPLGMRVAIFNSRQKLAVAGIIRRHKSDIQMDLTQSKYREEYRKARQPAPESGIPPNSLPVHYAKKALSRALQWFCSTPWVPFGIKRIILEQFYRLRGSVVRALHFR